MKRFQFIFLVLITSMQATRAQRIEDNSFIYGDGVTFSVLRFEGWKTTQYGNGLDMKVYTAKKGLTFKNALIEFANTTDKDVVIDFEQIFLLDSNNNKYYISSVAQGGKLTSNVERYKQTLKAGKTRKFYPVFWPAFPKDEKIERLLVDDIVINIKQIVKN